MFTSAPVIVTVPEAFKYALMFCAIATGAVTSWTVTVAKPVFTFPLLSVTVKVTVLAPKLAQVNVLGETDNNALLIPQASVEPLFICAGVIETFPAEFNWTVIFWVTTIGLTVSITVTVAVPVAEFPFTSVNDNVTVFAPVLLHINELGVTVVNDELIPQASVELLLTWLGVILTVPFGSK